MIDIHIHIHLHMHIHAYTHTQHSLVLHGLKTRQHTHTHTLSLSLSLSHTHTYTTHTFIRIWCCLDWKLSNTLRMGFPGKTTMGGRLEVDWREFNGKPVNRSRPRDLGGGRESLFPEYIYIYIYIVLFSQAFDGRTLLEHFSSRNTAYLLSTDG